MKSVAVHYGKHLYNPWGPPMKKIPSLRLHRAAFGTSFEAPKSKSSLPRSIAWGADIDAVSTSLWIGSDLPALGHAAYRGSELAIRELARLGANIDWVDDLGNTPLFLAAMRRQPVAMLALFESGADPLRANLKGENFLEPAEIARHAETISMARSIFEKASLQAVMPTSAHPRSRISIRL